MPFAGVGERLEVVLGDTVECAGNKIGLAARI